MSTFEIVIVAVTILTGTSIVWSTLTLGISPMPSSKKARKAIIHLTKDTGTGPIFDLGSGWGNLLIPLAKEYPERQIVGYELSLIPWLIASLIKEILSLNNLKIYRKNFFKADLSSASVIVCYLYPEGMISIAKKLISENITSCILISNNFSLPSQQPKKTVQLDDLYKSPVYLYDLCFLNPDI
ncbi:hypothetical protein [Motiliproteus sp. MSK22-1]|uniref:hypothetical protein n=1 Tax=Motiliproteus sp. MSK22-1 TaxID=1897630 RepID=UPI0009755177|nr:hypothetical protein [Motiliproteus sp. MSK22-1]OMH31733.1 hypothetical protein BGP75_16555 [Motiliproteus sp. MSK22-1]